MFLDGFCMKRPKTWRDLILSDTLVRRKCMRKPHSVPLGNWGGHRLGTNSFAPMHNPFETENCWTEAKSQSCYVVVKDMYIISDINLIYRCIYIYTMYYIYIHMPQRQPLQMSRHLFEAQSPSRSRHSGNEKTMQGTSMWDKHGNYNIWYISMYTNVSKHDQPCVQYATCRDCRDKVFSSFDFSLLGPAFHLSMRSTLLTEAEKPKAIVLRIKHKGPWEPEGGHKGKEWKAFVAANRA